MLRGDRVTRSYCEALASQLGVFEGYRTLWIDGAGEVLHTEPDAELDGDYRYAATLLHPDADELSRVLSGA